jgi:hypothetical protein
VCEKGVRREGPNVGGRWLNQCDIPQTRCPKHRGLQNATRICFPEGSEQGNNNLELEIVGIC